MSRMLLYPFLPDALMLGGMVPTLAPARPQHRVLGVAGFGTALLMQPGFSPRWLMTFGMAQPPYPAVDQSIGRWASLQVTGSITKGGETLRATLLGTPMMSLSLGVNDVDRLLVTDVGPDLGPSESLLPLGVTPLVRAKSEVDGTVADATALMVAGLSVTSSGGNSRLDTIWLLLGTGQTVGQTLYSVRLLATSDHGATREIDLVPIRCRAAWS